MSKEYCPCNFSLKTPRNILFCEEYAEGKPCVDSNALKKSSGLDNKMIDGMRGTDRKNVAPGRTIKSHSHYARK